MTQNLASPATADNLPIFSVGEIAGALKATIEGAFPLVRVRGEISGFKRAASGHIYFALKDSEAVLNAVAWRGAAGRLGLTPEDGMDVVATGRLTTYPGRSQYQLVVERLELAGQGALLKLLEERKRKLLAEGLFAAERKRKIPYLPDVIGVVTSPTGAVIRDILHRLAERFPRRVLLWPVRVQGEGAAEEIAAAIEGFNRLPAGGPVPRPGRGADDEAARRDSPPRPDLLIVARGGGSIEDLWAFNEEIVVRAAAASRIPLISAVGHETATTRIDFAADVRAPTPTAAEEMAVPVRAELLVRVGENESRLAAAIERLAAERITRLADLARALLRLPALVEERAQRLDEWTERLAHGLRVGLERQTARFKELALRLASPAERVVRAEGSLAAEARALKSALAAALKAADARLAQAGALLESVSYRSVLGRGYAVVRRADGPALTAAAAIRKGDRLTLEFHDGRAGAVAETGGAPTPDKSSPRRPPSPGNGRQGELL
ncbi:MAG: exodeoxyribonuclease VII large subunit [Rhodospirillales bacterium]|nr:exodeoxyribonuclease VII large subunit [Rhodospirillales bacterium]